VAKSAAIWSPEALIDIENIWDYYAATAGTRVADQLLRDIGQVIVLLEDFPMAGRVRHEVRPGLRSRVSGAHVIFYRLSDQRPLIVRILDGRRDIDEILMDTSDL
jgi:toxin ParE1/3/4